VFCFVCICLYFLYCFVLIGGVWGCCGIGAVASAVAVFLCLLLGVLDTFVAGSAGFEAVELLGAGVGVEAPCVGAFVFHVCRCICVLRVLVYLQSMCVGVFVLYVCWCICILRVLRVAATFAVPTCSGS
jgi:hypothetical protein